MPLPTTMQQVAVRTKELKNIPPPTTPRGGRIRQSSPGPGAWRICPSVLLIKKRQSPSVLD